MVRASEETSFFTRSYSEGQGFLNRRRLTLCPLFEEKSERMRALTLVSIFLACWSGKALVDGELDQEVRERRTGAARQLQNRNGYTHYGYPNPHSHHYYGYKRYGSDYYDGDDTYYVYRSKKGAGKGSTYSKGKGKGYKSDSGKGCGKGSKGSKSCFTCPPVEVVGSFTGEFTSFFEIDLELASNSERGITEAASLFAEAYNRVAALFATDIEIFESFLFTGESMRRLAHDDMGGPRELQLFQLDIYVEVVGFCNLCASEFTFSDQVIDGGSTATFGDDFQIDEDFNEDEEDDENEDEEDFGIIIPGGVRRLGELNCPLQGLPSAEQVLQEYNVLLEESRVPNVVSALDLEEVDRVSA